MTRLNEREVIEYLRTENAVLKDGFSKNPILLNEIQRRRLAMFVKKC